MAKKAKTPEDVKQETTYAVETVQSDPSPEFTPIDSDVNSIATETKKPAEQSRFKKLLNLINNNKKLSYSTLFLLIALIILAIPVTRYGLVGIFMKKDVNVYVVDSITQEKIYSAKVTVDSKNTKCQTSSPYPYCFVGVPVGRHRVKITTPHYKDIETTIEIGIGKAKAQNVQILQVQTGRLVSFNLSNKITGEPVADAIVKSGDSQTVTDDKGNGSIVVDPRAKAIDVSASKDGYNLFEIKVDMTVESKLNSLQLTPVGKVYFLSKQSGKIDVVKTNLDGSDRQIVVAGTGSEEDGSTVLLASSDWKYLVLQSRRAGAKSSIYLIDTSDDQMSEIDSGDATFSLVGWQDHFFAFTVNRDSVPVWQSQKSNLKTFNAENKQLTTTDQSTAEGSGDGEFASENIESIFLQKDSLIYVKRWSASYYSVYRLTGKRMGIYSAKLNGSSKQLLKDFEASNTGYINAVRHTLGEIYFNPSNLISSFYIYKDSKLTESSDLNSGSFSTPYPNYLLSPDGQKSFWHEPRDGKNALLVGAQQGTGGQEIANLSEYVPYGWFGNDFLLVSKNSSELYIMPEKGPGESGHIVKISDYHKQSYNFYGYGGN